MRQTTGLVSHQWDDRRHVPWQWCPSWYLCVTGADTYPLPIPTREVQGFREGGFSGGILQQLDHPHILKYYENFKYKVDRMKCLVARFPTPPFPPPVPPPHANPRMPEVSTGSELRAGKRRVGGRPVASLSRHIRSLVVFGCGVLIAIPPVFCVRVTDSPPPRLVVSRFAGVPPPPPPLPQLRVRGVGHGEGADPAAAAEPRASASPLIGEGGRVQARRGGGQAVGLRLYSPCKRSVLLCYAYLCSVLFRKFRHGGARCNPPSSFRVSLHEDGSRTPALSGLTPRWSSGPNRSVFKTNRMFFSDVSSRPARPLPPNHHHPQSLVAICCFRV